MANHTFSGSLSSGAATVTFTARYDYVVIENNDTTAANTFYVRTDGVAPSSPWTDAYEVPPGQSVMVSNDGPMWWQGFGGPTDPNGQANPGTVIKIVSVSGTATSPFEVSGAG